MEIRHRIEQVRFWVSDLSRPNSPIFDFSNQPAFYFFCDRPNPTRFYQVPILSPPQFQREVILALERAKPPIVIRRSPQQFDVFDDIDNSVRAQAVAGYINDHYTYTHSTWGTELWTRKKSTTAFNLDGYMRRSGCRRCARSDSSADVPASCFRRSGASRARAGRIGNPI